MILCWKTERSLCLYPYTDIVVWNTIQFSNRMGKKRWQFSSLSHSVTWGGSHNGPFFAVPHTYQNNFSVVTHFEIIISTQVSWLLIWFYQSEKWPHKCTLKNSLTTSEFVTLPLTYCPEVCEQSSNRSGTIVTRRHLGNGKIHRKMEWTL